MSAPRHVPIITGLFWVAISASVWYFWATSSTATYWIKDFIAGALLLFGLDSLRRGFFSADTEINQLVNGKAPSNDERLNP
jgi:hypothetical protein